MTAKTSTQRSEAHRNREKAKVARMREALEEIARVNGGADWNGTRSIALSALDAVGVVLCPKCEKYEAALEEISDMVITSTRNRADEVIGDMIAIARKALI